MNGVAGVGIPYSDYASFLLPITCSDTDGGFAPQSGGTAVTDEPEPFGEKRYNDICIGSVLLEYSCGPQDYLEITPVFCITRCYGTRCL